MMLCNAVPAAYPVRIIAPKNGAKIVGGAGVQVLVEHVGLLPGQGLRVILDGPQGFHLVQALEYPDLEAGGVQPFLFSPLGFDGKYTIHADIYKVGSPPTVLFHDKNVFSYKTP